MPVTMVNVIVTGGSRGLGFGIARTLMDHGFNVIAVARRFETSISSRDNLWCPVVWDLADLPSLPDLARQLRDEFGSIYGLVNNAGMSLAGILSTTASAKIIETVNLNVLSPIILTKNIVPSMMAARAGRIINISSIVATTGYPGLSVYSATKASMIGFTHSLAREVGPLGITVNAVAPGFLDTEMTHDLNEKQRAQIAGRSAMQRMATVGDVAAMVSFLMSDAAANITGTVMTVDAGNTT